MKKNKIKDIKVFFNTYLECFKSPFSSKNCEEIHNAVHGIGVENQVSLNTWKQPTLRIV
jgi:hypothetical protein